MKIALTNVPPGRADGIAESLVREGLAACVNAFPVKSTYVWKDKLEVDQEVTLLIKVAADRVDNLTRRIRELHPYEVPEILILPVDVEASWAAYVAFVRSAAPLP